MFSDLIEAALAPPTLDQVRSHLVRLGGDEGRDGMWEERVDSHLPWAVRFARGGATLTESEGDVVLSRPLEASSGLGSFSGHLRAEFDRDIDLYLSKRLVSSSGLEGSCPWKVPLCSISRESLCGGWAGHRSEPWHVFESMKNPC